MNCKQIREAIDTASRHNLYGGNVTSHLNDCPDCHRYSDETTSLLGLLGAQPRVEAPPDFDFRLRARMVRAQAATTNDPQSFLRKIRPATFSWGQMVATAAALALVVTVSTFYFDRDNPAPGSGSDLGAPIAVVPQPGGTEPAPKHKSPAVEPPRATPINFTSRRLSGRTAPFEPAPSTKAVSRNDNAGIDGSTRFYNRETKRLLKGRSRFYGAETASISPRKPATIALTF
jgi:hypothetical protein